MAKIIEPLRAAKMRKAVITVLLKEEVKAAVLMEPAKRTSTGSGMVYHTAEPRIISTKSPMRALCGRSRATTPSATPSSRSSWLSSIR